MYLNKLISLVRKFPELSDTSIDNIDMFIGRRGTNNLFTREEILGLMRQRKDFSNILTWLCDEKIIEPYTKECYFCRKKYPFTYEICPYCGQKTQFDESNIAEYKIIEKINLSKAEIEQEKNKKLKLDKSSFDILLKILEKKYRNHEESYIIFTDVKDSTEIKRNAPSEQEKICNGAVAFFRKISEPYFRASKGIYIKPEGDASYIFLDNLDVVKRFVKDVNEKIKVEEISKIMAYVNSKEFKIENNPNPLTTFIKMYIAHSQTGSYFQKDILTIDFNAMDAFTFIKRIEKSVKEEIFKKQVFDEYKKNFPLCIFSQDDIFNGKLITLHNIENLGNVNISYSNNEMITNNLG